MKRERRRRWGAGFLAGILVLGPGTAASAAETRDMLGRVVRLPERISRVVSLAPSVTEIAFALGAGDKLVGVTDHCDYPDEAKQKPRVGGFYAPNFEAIVSLKPDLVLATSIEGGRSETFAAIEALRVPVYLVRPLDFAAVVESIERIGALLGAGPAAARLAGSMRRDAREVADAVAARARPRVLYVLWASPLIVPGRETLITDLIDRAGGASVTGNEPDAYPRLSLEEAVARGPDLVVVGVHGQATADGRPEAWRQLLLLPAVRAGRVHRIDGDLMHRAGPRITDALRRLARMFHPGAVR